ncbi:unnamed protein product [Somion occarium]|uniref:Ras-GAP domain-containing protein n=1 Tax=Somion occarium TaxID=3059160 RepID=A0ABP1CWN5_9APHY
MVHILVTRLKHKLPCNAGTTLTELEDDLVIHQTIEALVDLAGDSLGLIAHALTDQLHRLAQIEAPYRGVDVLQSQLFLLKVLSVAMASHSNRFDDTRPNSRIGKASEDPASVPSSPSPSMHASRGRQPSYDRMSINSTKHEIPPLVDDAAKYVLSIMILFLQQTAPPAPRLMSAANLNFNASYHDFESVESQEGPNPLEHPHEIPKVSSKPKAMYEFRDSHLKSADTRSINSSSFHPLHSAHYEKTSTVVSDSCLSLNSLIAKFAGKVIYHLSASNWSVVFDRIRIKIRELAHMPDNANIPELTDLQLLMHCALDKTRLIQSLQELASLLVHIRKEVQAAMCQPLRTAIWNWIENFPDEFNEALLSHRRLEGAAERVFDLLYPLHEWPDKTFVWPALTVLLCISSERTKSEYQMVSLGPMPPRPGPRKDRTFADQIIRTMTGRGKGSEMAMVCALDICRAASRVRPNPEVEVPLISVANDVAHEASLFSWGPDSLPFWATLEDIDVALMGDALVTIYRFLPPADILPIFHRCLEPTRSDAVKTAVVKACITLVTEANALPWTLSPEELRVAICERVTSIYRHSVMRRSEIDADGIIKKPALRPKGKRYTAETVSDRELLSLSCLALYRADVWWFLCVTHVDTEPLWVPGAVELWLAPSDASVKISMNRTTRFAFDAITQMSPEHPAWDHCASWMACAMPATLAAICINLLDSRTDFKAQHMYISMAIEIMHRFTRPSAQHFVRVQRTVERIPAFLIAEISFLVSLTSADRNVSAIACQCLRLLAVAERQPNAPCNTPFNDDERLKRYPMYDQLGADQKSVLGRVAHQKRIRKIMRMLTLPPAVHMAVWQECYFRWCTLNELAIRMSLDSDDLQTQPTGDKSLTMEERQAQWQNLTLFMASFGPAVLKENVDAPALSALVRDEYLPDQMRIMRDPGDLLTIFLTEVINLLVHESAQARKVAEETLGNELNPRLYLRILKELDSVLQDITNRDNLDWEMLSIFLESFIPIATVLSENVKNVQDIHGVDMGATLHTLADFIRRFQGTSGYRLKTRFCALCETVFDPKTCVSPRKDNSSRQTIAEFIIEWVADPIQVDAEHAQLQRDLNSATLRTAVKIFDHLKLESPDGLAEDDAAHYVSRLFIRYTQFLQKVSDFGRSELLRDEGVADQISIIQHRTSHHQEGEYRELVVTGLASLISSNTEFGIKHCLPLAYDQDPLKQTTFTHVFARVLSQGVTLSTRDASSNISRQSKLCELIKGPDSSLALAICEVCPSDRHDEMIEVLLDVFDTKSSLVNLLKAMVDREIARTENEADLFRSNSFYCVFMSTCARLYGYNYLRSLLIPLLKTIASLPPGHKFEIDPVMVGEQAAADNQQVVELVASSFIDIITSSVPAFPSMFREVCAHIVSKVTARWSKSKFSALGAFIFLRFINPCIVFPPRVDLPLDTKMMAGLKLVAKIIQNLANNILFGKEAHMQSLNLFLEKKISNITTFLSALAKYTPSGPEDEHEEWLETPYDDTDTILLQRFFMNHVDKIGKELLSSPRILDDTGPDGEATSKSSWQAICSAIYESNVHTEIPLPTDATTSTHAPYKELMSRFGLRDVSSVQHLLVETPVPKYERAVFVLSVAKIDVEVLDLELLLYHILQTLTTPQNINREFEIIFDWTYFSAASNVPIQWVKFAYEVIPKDVRQRLRVSHFLTPNDMALRYMRKLAIIVNGSPFSDKYLIHSSVHELLEYFPPGTVLHPLMEAYMQEDEPRELFTDVTMRLSQPLHAPIHLEVAASYLRITTMRPVSYCRTQKAKAIEIIPLTDVSDAYNVSTGHELNEFVIRKTRHGSTLYFASPLREAIVKTIRCAKGNVKNIQRPITERFSKLSNVVATLLHVGMLNIGSHDDELRLAAYDLLSAICIYLDFEGRPVVPAKSVFIPGHPGPFVTQLSEKLAPFAPHLTLDFIAAIAAMDKTSISQKINCLQYLSPWIKNLSFFMDPLHRLFEPSGTKFRDCIRTLIDLTLADPEIYAVLQRHIWIEVGKLDSNVVNAVLDELMRAAVDGGMGSQRCEIIADVMTAVTSINVRGRIFARIRKVLGKTSTKPTKDLADNPHWTEIACLTRLAMVANYHPRNIVHAQLYVPEAAHLVTLIAGTGEVLVRQSVYGIVVNLLNAVFLARSGELTGLDVKALLDECIDPGILRSFGLRKASRGNDFESYDPDTDKERIDLLENLTSFLGRIMKAISGSSGLLNVWRARWMSLITSSAFQFSPAIQTRAFISMGMLATSDVDDDLLYQMLVAFKTALSQFNEKETLAMISMLRCMYHVVPALPPHSRYLPQLFWLAVALLETGFVMIYSEAIQLLRATVERMDVDKEFEVKGVAVTLMDARAPLESISIQLDHLLSLSFHTSFHFSLAAIIFKGVRHAGLHKQAEAALRSLLRITVQSCGEIGLNHAEAGAGEPICQEVLGYVIALIPLHTSLVAYQELLLGAKVHSSWTSEDFLPSVIDYDEAIHVPLGLLGIVDRRTALFTTSFISAMLQTAQGDDKETEMLYGILSDLAHSHPETIAIAFDSFHEKLKDAFTISSRPMVLAYVSNIFRVSTQENMRGLRGQSSASTLSTVDEKPERIGKKHLAELDSIDMGGLANSLQFVAPSHYRQVSRMINFLSELVMKIIE